MKKTQTLQIVIFKCIFTHGFLTSRYTELGEKSCPEKNCCNLVVCFIVFVLKVNSNHVSIITVNDEEHPTAGCKNFWMISAL